MLNKRVAVILFFISSSFVYALDNELSISLATTSFDYAEKYQGILQDTEKANLSGLQGIDIRYKRHNGGIIGEYGNIYADLSYFSGNTNYIGSLQGGNYGDLTHTTPNRLFEPSIGVIDMLKIANSLGVGYDLGVGYYSWYRDSSGQAGDYSEHYTIPYYKIGVICEYISEMDRNLKIGAEVAYKQAFSPHLSTGLNDSFNLGNSEGYTVSMPISYRLTNSLSTTIEYDYNHWSFGMSNVNAGGFLEPDSTTNNQMFKVGLNYKF